MISLEQVRQLDIRVKKAVSTVKTLTAENTELKQKITDLEAQISELTDEAEGRRASEQELEVSLQGVLDVLDEVDDETADIEPEAPTENYTIATVALTDESDGTESLEPEGSAISPEQPEPADEIDSPAESPAEDSGEESPASPCRNPRNSRIRTKRPGRRRTESAPERTSGGNTGFRTVDSTGRFRGCAGCRPGCGVRTEV